MIDKAKSMGAKYIIIPQFMLKPDIEKTCPYYYVSVKMHNEIIKKLCDEYNLIHFVPDATHDDLYDFCHLTESGKDNFIDKLIESVPHIINP